MRHIHFDWVMISPSPYPVHFVRHASFPPPPVLPGSRDSQGAAATLLLTPPAAITTRGCSSPRPWAAQTLACTNHSWGHHWWKTEHVQEAQCHVIGGFANSLYHWELLKKHTLTDYILKVCLLCRVMLTVFVSSAILTSTKGLAAKQSCSAPTHSTRR